MCCRSHTAVGIRTLTKLQSLDVSTVVELPRASIAVHSTFMARCTLLKFWNSLCFLLLRHYMLGCMCRLLYRLNRLAWRNLWVYCFVDTTVCIGLNDMLSMLALSYGCPFTSSKDVKSAKCLLSLSQKLETWTEVILLISLTAQIAKRKVVLPVSSYLSTA